MKEKFKEKVRAFLLDFFVEQLALTPEEQQEKKEMLKSKKETISENIEKIVIKVIIYIAIAFIVTAFAVLVSAPAREFLVGALKDIRPLSKALWDFSPKLSYPLAAFLSAYTSLLVFMRLYGIKNGSEAASRIAIRLAVACISNFAITVISTFIYSFSTGSLAPIITLALETSRPCLDRMLLIFVAAYLAAVIASVVEIIRVLIEGYKMADKLLLKIYIYLIYC